MRRTIAGLVGLVLVASAAVGVEAESALAGPGAQGQSGGLPEDLQPRRGQSGPGPEQVPWEASSVAPLGSSDGEPPAEVDFPEPGGWEVTLREPGEAAEVSEGEAGPVEVQVSSGEENAADVAGEPLDVEIHDRATARRVGASGFVFTVSDPAAGRDGALPEGSDADAEEGEPVPVDVAVDYSGFEEAYGGGYADRLQVVALPDCAVLDPVPRGCDTRGVRLETRNNRETATLTAEVEDLAELAATDPVPPVPEVPEGVDLPGPAAQSRAGSEAETDDGANDGADDGSAVLAVTADVDGETGSYGATPLSIAGDWQVAPGSGEFTWTYPLSLPEPPGGSAPSVALGYSSGAVDGLTNGTNPQGSPAGLGWGDFAGGFIERRYEPCVNANIVMTRDLCWKNQNGIISLGGVNGVMFPLDGGATQWAVQDDEGWRVERLTGASGNGDNDGEYWKVTATDGTQYIFGQQGNATLHVPVIADSAGEPCRSTPTTSCDQAWRWMLDRVVDPNGNVTTYRYDRFVNRYRSVEGLGVDEPYHAGAILSSIEYGSNGGNAAAARVTFAHTYRCSALDSTCTTAPNSGNAASFPDTPNDLICSSGCTAHAPAFFNPWRYDYAQTEVRLSGAWKPVQRWNLYHTWGRDSANKYPRMLLETIQRVGVADTDGDGNLSLLPYPDVDLYYTRNANRVDADRAAGRDPMENWRLGRIVNELQGETHITYGHNRTCAADYNPSRWDQNVRDCFPQAIKEGNPQFTRRGIFHKYLVMSVVDLPMDGGTNVQTDYTYEGDPGWGYVLEAWTGYDAMWAWSNWRGYATAVVTNGTSRTRMRVFRGMHKDKVLRDAGGGTLELVDRDFSTTNLTGDRSFLDERSLAGRILEEERLGPLGGASETRLQSTLYEYEVRVTHPNVPDVVDHRWPRWAGMVRTTENVYSAPGQFRQRGGQTTYNTRLQAATSTELGWLDVNGDERCSITTYAENPTALMFNYPATNRMVAGTDCNTTDPAKLLSYSETAYDDQAVGAAPTRGNATLERARIEGTRFAETHTVFDSWGRPTEVTDPNGGVTRTRYLGCLNSDCTVQELGVIPTRIEVTNPAGHKTVTDYLQQYGLPSKVTDQNGKVTSYTYDGLGRLEAVWLPDAPLAFAEPSWRYSYDMPNRAVRTRQLVSEARSGSGVRFIDNWTTYDGLGRQRQTQAQSPTSGKVVVGATAYDGRGMVRIETVPQAVTGTPGAVLSVTWLNRTTYDYDALGRLTAENWYRSTDLAHTTTTEYTVDTVTVTGPEGNRVRQTVDGLGRTVAVAEHDGSQWVSTTYDYNLADQLETVTDPAGNVITYEYDLAGRRLSQSDPDRGSATFTYDDGGNQTSVTDGNGNTISTVYDALGRARERWVGAPQTGTRTASWVYDAAGQLGLLDKEIRHTTQGDWVSDVTAYDVMYRTTGSTFTVPAGIPGLSGTYTMSQTYNRADQVLTTSLPAVGDLPAETLTTTYNSLGMPSTMTSGLEAYVRGEVYDDRGRLAQSLRGPNQPGTNHMVSRTYSYDTDQQLSGTATYLRTTQSGASYALVSADQLDYDEAGRLAEREVWQGNVTSASWSECYRYDPRQRLTDAYTIAGAAVSGSADCETATRGGGSQPYVHEYAYTVDGRLDVRTEDGTATQYDYPAAGQPQVHAPTDVGDDTYEWDDAGNLTSRTVDGVTETFTWDAEQRLSSVQRQGETTSFVYDAGGRRLLRRTPDGTTLYWAGHEITANADGSQVRAVRSYGFNGETIATRSASGVQYLASNESGSVEAAVTTPGQPATGERTYEPFGEVRQETGSFQTDRGFIGQIEDESTNLSYLNARYYDTTTGIFISPDPLYDTSEPKSLNPYVYGMGNPTTLSDPTGLSPLETFTLEGQVNDLRYANRQLVKEVKRLGGVIGELQSIIRKQQNVINRLLTYIGTLESIIRQQQSIIGQLQARVVSLVGQVNYWRGQAYYWRGQAIYWKGQAMYWRGQAMYWKGQAIYWKGRAVYWHGRAVYWKGRADLWQERSNRWRSRALGSVSPAQYERWTSEISGAWSEYRGGANPTNGPDWVDITWMAHDMPGLRGQIYRDTIERLTWLDEVMSLRTEMGVLRDQMDEPPPSGGGAWDWVDDLCSVVDAVDLGIGASGANLDARVQGGLLIASGTCMVIG